MSYLSYIIMSWFHCSLPQESQKTDFFCHEYVYTISSPYFGPKKLLCPCLQECFSSGRSGFVTHPHLSLSVSSFDTANGIS